jgi:hypothetical protein
MDWIQTPTLYGAQMLEDVPTFYIINRDGEVVTQKVGELPDDFYELCLSKTCFSGANIGTGKDE